jgi:hypothetical protein
VVLYQLSYACVREGEKRALRVTVNRFFARERFILFRLQIEHELVARLHRQRDHPGGE